MKGRSAKNKGARAERYVEKRIREEVDSNAHRTPGSGAGLDKNDVRIPSCDVEIEVKHQQKLMVLDWWEQAETQTTSGNTPMVVFNNPRKTPEFSQLLAILDFEDMLELLKGDKDTVVVTEFPSELKWKANRLREDLRSFAKELE